MRTSVALSDRSGGGDSIGAGRGKAESRSRRRPGGPSASGSGSGDRAEVSEEERSCGRPTPGIPDRADENRRAAWERGGIRPVTDGRSAEEEDGSWFVVSCRRKVASSVPGYRDAQARRKSLLERRMRRPVDNFVRKDRRVFGTCRAPESKKRARGRSNRMTAASRVSRGEWRVFRRPSSSWPPSRASSPLPWTRPRSPSYGNRP